jgi:hypothetical protein
MDKKKEEKQKKKIRFFGVWSMCEFVTILFLLSLGIICVLLSLYRKLKGIDIGSFSNDFILQVGSAFIVAVILILTVETFARRNQAEREEEYLRKVNEDVFRAVFRKSVPSTILTEVIDRVVKPSFIRKDFKVRYFLEPLQNKKYKECLKGKVEVEYTLENTTNDWQDYTIRSKISTELLPDKGANLKFGYLQIIRQGHPEEKEKIEQNPQEFLKFFERSIALEPLEKDLIIRYDVELFLFSRHSDVWVNNSPTENLILTISDKDGLLQKGAMALHPSSRRLNINVKNPVTTEWQIKGGLLPCQGINFWWYPKEPENKVEYIT